MPTIVLIKVNCGTASLFRGWRGWGLDGLLGMKMNKEFLENYEAMEREEIIKFTRNLYDGKIERGKMYYPPNRLKLNEPYTRNIKQESLWNQLLPNIGTVVIELWPIKEKNDFESMHGFKIEDIGRLIDFAKETGKVQFGLGVTPLLFKECDFLESILLELRPPTLIHIEPIAAFSQIDPDKGTFDFSRTDEKIKIWSDEFFFFRNICN